MRPRSANVSTRRARRAARARRREHWRERRRRRRVVRSRRRRECRRDCRRMRRAPGRAATRRAVRPAPWSTARRPRRSGQRRRLDPRRESRQLGKIGSTRLVGGSKHCDQRAVGSSSRWSRCGRRPAATTHQPIAGRRSPPQSRSPAPPRTSPTRAGRGRRNRPPGLRRLRDARDPGPMSASTSTSRVANIAVVASIDRSTCTHGQNAGATSPCQHRPQCTPTPFALRLRGQLRRQTGLSDPGRSGDDERAAGSRPWPVRARSSVRRSSRSRPTRR